MRLVVLLLLLVQLGGCTLTRGGKPSPIGDVSPPPVLSKYINDDSTLTEDISRYTDDMNLYMNYIFGYTKELNGYAKSIGWSPPEQSPLCRLINSPQLEPFPKFKPPTHGRTSFEWELSNFIRDLRKMHGRDSDALRRAVIYQRGHCLY